MSKSQTLLEKMRANPKKGWTINDVQKLCNEFGMSCSSPTRGSHYKVSSAMLEGHLTVPHKRPIKPIYIKHLTNMVEAHLAAQTEDRND